MLQASTLAIIFKNPLTIKKRCQIPGNFFLCPIIPYFLHNRKFAVLFAFVSGWLPVMALYNNVQ